MSITACNWLSTLFTESLWRPSSLWAILGETFNLAALLTQLSPQNVALSMDFLSTIASDLRAISVALWAIIWEVSDFIILLILDFHVRRLVCNPSSSEEAAMFDGFGEHTGREWYWWRNEADLRVYVECSLIGNAKNCFISAFKELVYFCHLAYLERKTHITLPWNTNVPNTCMM